MMSKEYILIDGKNQNLKEHLVNQSRSLGESYETIEYIVPITTKFNEDIDILIIDISNIGDKSNINNLKDYLNYKGYSERIISEVVVEDVEQNNKLDFTEIVNIFAIIIFSILIFFIIVFIKNRRYKRENLFKEK